MNTQSLWIDVRDSACALGVSYLVLKDTFQITLGGDSWQVAISIDEF